MDMYACSAIAQLFGRSSSKLENRKEYIPYAIQQNVIPQLENVYEIAPMLWGEKQMFQKLDNLTNPSNQLVVPSLPENRWHRNSTLEYENIRANISSIFCHKPLQKRMVGVPVCRERDRRRINSSKSPASQELNECRTWGRRAPCATGI